MNMMQAEQLDVALIGYGLGGKTFHAPLITHVRGLRLTHVLSSDTAKVKKDLPNVAVVPAADDIFSNPNIDLVVITTPNATHYDLASRALLAGKHVVVDKPFTTTVAEASQLVTQAAKSKKLLSVFQNRRWDSDFLTLRHILQQGSLGEITQFESHYDRYRPQLRQRWKEQPGPGSGLWYDLGPHLVDQALQFFGMPEALYADFAFQREGTQTPDYFHVLLRYGQRRVVLHGSSLVLGPTLRFAVYGKTGSYIKYGIDPQEDELKRGDIPCSANWGADPQPGTLITISEDGSETESHPSLPGNYLAYYEGVRDAILKGAPNPVPAEEAVAVVKILEVALQSAEQRSELCCSRL
jgi:predicted dehydrogenase